MTQLEGLVPQHHETISPDLLRDIQQAVLKLPPEYLQNIEAGETYSMCARLNYPICETLRNDNHIDAYCAESSDERTMSHEYGVVTTENGEVIVDAAISQFIYGFNRVFVGTRDDLRKLVLDPRTTIINTGSRDNKPEAFQRIWGDNYHIFRPRSR
ncbi:MAG: hypothetical protein WCL07_03855 [bacterium]